MTCKELSIRFGVNEERIRTIINSLGIKMVRGPKGTDFSESQLQQIFENVKKYQKVCTPYEEEPHIQVSIPSRKNNPEEEVEENEDSVDEILEGLEKEEIDNEILGEDSDFDIEENEEEEDEDMTEDDDDLDLLDLDGDLDDDLDLDDDDNDDTFEEDDE